MKNIHKLIGISVIVTAIAFSLAACENGLQGGADKTGKLIVTGIPPQYNGKYAVFAAESAVFSGVNIYLGISNLTDSFLILPKISGGSVTLNMYVVSYEGAYHPFTGNIATTGSLSIYDKNHTDFLELFSSDTPREYSTPRAEIPFIAFKNGSAKISVEGYSFRPGGGSSNGGGGGSYGDPGGGSYGGGDWGGGSYGGGGGAGVPTQITPPLEP